MLGFGSPAFGAAAAHSVSPASSAASDRPTGMKSYEDFSAKARLG
jgi:hypothetical protein